jgi:hypothetical protein
MKIVKGAGLLVSLPLFSAIGFGGCAMVSGYPSGPNGRPVYYIDGMSASVAFQKATELCPDGYSFISEPRQTSDLDYVMTIECK